MLDDIGINQHHDAVTGTGKQAVANDYAWRLYRGMSQNNKVYNQAIADLVQTKSGLKSDKDWQQCFRTNSTYLDCPISDFGNLDGYDFTFAVHNPSSNPLNEVRIAVP